MNPYTEATPLVASDVPAGKRCCTRCCESKSFKHSLAYKIGTLRSTLLVIGILCNSLMFYFAQLGGGPRQVAGGVSGATDSEYWGKNALFIGELKVSGYIDPSPKCFDLSTIHMKLPAPLPEVSLDVPGALCPEKEYEQMQRAVCPLTVPSTVDCKVHPNSGSAHTLASCDTIACKGFTYDHKIIQMSYWYSVWELWTLCTPSPGDCQEHPAQLAAALLFLFSFLWPHVKLMMLLCCLFVPFTRLARRHTLYWLAVFGKWSFTDVIVMATIIAIFDIVINTSLPELWPYMADSQIWDTCRSDCETIYTEDCGAILTYVIPKLPDIIKDKLPFKACRSNVNGRVCQAELKTGCATMKHVLPPEEACSLFCEAPSQLINRTIANPEVMGSSITATVRLNGMTCMYVFCFAVVLSLLMGMAVDVEDEKVREEEDKAAKDEPSAEDDEAARTAKQAAEDAAATERLGGMHVECLGANLGMLSSSASFVHLGMLLLTVAMEICASVTTVVSRKCVGSIPIYLNEAFHLDFDEDYSMHSIATILGSFGGWNYLKSVVMWLFIIVGPLCRTVSEILVLACPMPIRWRRGMHKVSRVISVFFALEVAILALPILAVTLAGVSSEIITTDSVPVCRPLNAKYNTDTCFEIKGQIAYGYGFIIAAVVMYAITGFDGSPTHKFLHARLEPEDIPPPTCNYCAPCCSSIESSLEGIGANIGSSVERVSNKIGSSVEEANSKIHNVTSGRSSDGKVSEAPQK